MSRIMITGNCGFIGRALEKELVANDHEVCGTDKSYGEFVEVDFEHVLGRHRSLLGQVDVVVHLAAEVGKLNCELNPRLATEVNVIGTFEVARACAKAGIPLVYCSTSEVYGDYGDHLIHENFATRPSSGMYGLTKLWGEHVAQAYAPEGLKIVRPTMPYGPGVPPGPGRRALDNLVWQALTGQPMVVHRNAARSWCWIDDVASGLRAVIERGEPGAYNVGRDDDEVFMDGLARLIAVHIAGEQRFDQVGPAREWARIVKSIKVIDPPARQTAVKLISCAKLRALGWEPRTSLDEGLPKMIDWIRSWMASCEERQAS